MRELNKIPLSGLRAIEAVGRLGSLGRAAEELGVTSGALSQRLGKAEGTLGRKLFAREPSGLVPTDICVSVLPRLTRAMADLAAVVEEVDSAQRCALVVSVAPVFASRWLIWRIRHFCARWPDIAVRIEPDVALADLDSADIDIGIRLGCKPGPGQAVKLVDQRVLPVCAPGLAKRIREPADLLALPVIRENDLVHGWDAWLAPLDVGAGAIPAGPNCRDTSHCLDAAMAGRGLYMACETLARDALARGGLVAPFPRGKRTGAAYWFVTGAKARRNRNAGRFLAWLQDEMAGSIPGRESETPE